MTDQATPRARKSAEEKRQERIAEKRAKRVPLGASKKRLEAKIPKGYASRWVNDEQDKLYERFLAGWRFVKDAEGFSELEVVEENQNLGNYVCKRVGSTKEGSGLTAYLMVIEEELHAEDVARNRERLSQIESQIRHGQYERGSAGGEEVKNIRMDVKTGRNAFPDSE